MLQIFFSFISHIQTISKSYKIFLQSMSWISTIFSESSVLNLPHLNYYTSLLTALLLPHLPLQLILHLSTQDHLENALETPNYFPPHPSLRIKPHFLWLPSKRPCRPEPAHLSNHLYYLLELLSSCHSILSHLRFSMPGVFFPLLVNWLAPCVP